MTCVLALVAAGSAAYSNADRSERVAAPADSVINNGFGACSYPQLTTVEDFSSEAAPAVAAFACGLPVSEQPYSARLVDGLQF